LAKKINLYLSDQDQEIFENLEGLAEKANYPTHGLSRLIFLRGCEEFLKQFKDIINLKQGNNK